MLPQLTKLVSGTFMVQVLAAGLAAVLHIVLARILGASEYGIFTFVYSFLFLAILPIKFGYDTLSMRMVSSLNAKNEWSRLSGFLRHTRISIIKSVLFWTLFICCILFLFRDEIRNELLIPVIVAIPALLLLPTLHILQYIIRGFGRVVVAGIPEAVIRPLLLLFACLLAYLLKPDVTAVDMISVNNLVLLVCVLLAFYIYKSLLPEGLTNESPLYDRKEWKLGARHFFLISSIHLVLSQTDILMLGSLRTSEEVGLYSASVRIAVVASLFLQAVSSALAPTISSLYSTGKPEELKKVARFAATMTFGASAPICILIIIFPAQLLSLFGPEFTAAAPVLIILAIGQFIKSAFGPAGFLLTMTGNEKYAARYYGAGAVVNIVLNAVLIQKFGILGAAYATTLTTILTHIALVLRVKKSLGFAPLPSLQGIRS